MLIRRPLWRSFTERFIDNAVTHVGRGGHAMLWRRGTAKPVAWMLLPCTVDGALPELAFWSILGIDKRTWSAIPSGVAKGLATMRIPRDREWAVEEWCERDSKWQGSTRDVELDCLTCAACCIRNRVVLDADDLARWNAANRQDLAGKAYTRTVNGEVVLRLAPDGGCVHLRGKACSIYALRPDNCSVFPAGSEPCLASREEEFGWTD